MRTSTASLLVLTSIATPASAAIQALIFQVRAAESSLLITPAVTSALTGNLLGDFDATTNPTGTQTRPGLSGGTGNIPVPVTATLGTTQTSTSVPAGHFRADIDADAGFLNISFLDLDLLGGATAAVPIQLGLTYQTFRTFQPTSLYPGGVPINLPIGEASITALRALQTAPIAPAILIPAGEGRFSFATAVPATITVGFSLLGQGLPPTEIPGILPLAGELDLSSGIPVVRVQWSGEIQEELPPEVIAEIPAIEQAFDLPTILPPGRTAHLLLSLAVDRVTLGTELGLELTAAGSAHCASDFNNDGFTDCMDYDAFVAAYEVGSPVADMDRDFFIDGFDYDAFVSVFENGCD